LAYILNIDTSSKNCSVALQNDDALVASYDIHIEKSASSLINLYCDRIVKDAGITLNDLNAIAVGIGPGSYTGLRIAVSTAKGFALGLDIPLVAVDTLEAMAYSQINFAEHQQALICPMLDARRMEVYTCLFRHDLSILKKTEALILDENCYKAELDQQKIIFLGDGAVKLQNILEHPNAIFIPNIIPSARFMIAKSWDNFSNKLFADVAYLEPYYLKEFMSLQKTLPQK
jgi:tRNA threonylcarbamoyladenosine biosynthesis protein TsaB